MNRKIFHLLLICTASIVAEMSAGESGCAKCQMIREYNALHPQKDEYYEDYLKEHPKDRVESEQDVNAKNSDGKEQPNQSK